MALKLYCSFCGKSSDEVAHLVTGASSAICDECVAVSAEIVKREGQVTLADCPTSLFKPPDYDVCALDKQTEERGRIGAAWKNRDGSIRVVLSPFVTVTYSRDVVISLFPHEAKT